MTSAEGGSDPEFAELVDELLEQLLNGDEPDVAVVAARHPAAAHRIDEALALAGGVAGRRLFPRPALRGYEIVRELGRGGMGTVYLARQASLDREVALKVLPQSFGLSAHNRQRFLEEARALARVKHQHIVEIHRIVDDGDLLAFEMEFVEGPSLQGLLDHLRAHRKNTGTAPTLAQVAELLGLPAAELGARNLTQFFVRLLLKVARALGAVHAGGFVHRDIKPANVLLRRNGEPVLVDFGLVRLTDLALSRTAGFAGTPVYSSPEQLRGSAPVGPASDVYGLAVTLYECLTLTTPFAGQTTTDLLRRIESGHFAPLRRAAPGTPRDLETIVAHAMEIEPAKRYATAEAFADDLQRLLDLQPIQARPVGPVRRLGKFLARNRSTLLAGCIGAALVVAAMMPLLDRVEAAGRRRDLAREHVRAAQQRLISIDVQRLALLFAGAGRPSRPRLQATGDAVEHLRAALAEYERAQALDPANPAANREHDVVQLCLWLRQLTVPDTDALDRAFAGEEFQSLSKRLGPFTIEAARILAEGRGRWFDDPARATNEDRASLGLLGFLMGNFRLSESSWATLPPELREQPLIDAGLGSLHLADGVADQAYIRLLQAHRSFPESVSLTLDLADAALSLGDLALARHWLARVPPAPDVEARRRRIDLDLRATADLGEAMDAEYETLAALDPLDPTPRHRLVGRALRRGDLARAATLLDALLRDWPEVARFHLDRARLALQQRDIAAYAREVLEVLDQDGGWRSRASTACVMEILRIGGLNRLFATALTSTGGELSGKALLGGEIPIRGFLPARLAADFETLAVLLHETRRMAMVVRRAGLPDPMQDALLGVLLFAARLPAIAPATSLPRRVAFAALPWVVREAYPRAMPVLQRLFLAWPDGEATAVSATAVERPAGHSPEHSFGNALLRVDDCNGDGIDDVLVACTARHPDVAQGEVLLVDGRRATVLESLAADTDEHMFGHSLALAGDLDGDGRVDWLIGAPAGTRETRFGEVEVWSGRTRQMLWRIEGDGPGFGVGVTGLGDVDGDGVPDFALSTAPLLLNTAAQGSVHVYSGRSRQVIRTLRNDVPGVWFGTCIANAGDADADGADDLLVGGNYGGAPGLARLYSGRTGAVLQSWSDSSLDSGFGTCVLGAGDVDGDGHADVVVTAVRADETAGPDLVLVLSGSTGRELARLSGDKPGSGFGASVALYRAGAGQTLLAIGQPLAGAGRTGAVQFWSPAGKRIGACRGPTPLGRLGSAITTCTDTDGDGRPELFVSGPPEQGEGMVWRIASSQLGLDW